MLLEVKGVALTEKGSWKITGGDGKTYYAKKEATVALGLTYDVTVTESKYKDSKGVERVSKWVTLKAASASPKSEKPVDQISKSPSGDMSHQEFLNILATELGLATLCTVIFLQGTNPSMAVVKATAHEMATFFREGK